MVKDESRVPEILKQLKLLNNKRVRVGVFSDEIGLVAGVNEFGAKIKVTDKMRAYLHSIGLHLKDTTKFIVIPERSFLRSTFDNKKVIDSVFERGEDVFFNDFNVLKMLDVIGKSMGEKIKIKISSNIKPENHPFTIIKKGSNKTLVDKGSLEKSITYEVK